MTVAFLVSEKAVITVRGPRAVVLFQKQQLVDWGFKVVNRQTFLARRKMLRKKELEKEIERLR